MKRITLLHYKLDNGGIDRVTTLLASGFAEAGYDLTLLLFCKDGSAENIYREQMHENVKIIHLGESQSTRTKDLIRLLPKAIQWLRDNPNDLLLSTCNNMNWISLLVAKRAKSNAKVIFKTTNPIIRNSDTGLYALLRKWGYKKAFEKADLTLTLSEAESRELQQAFPSAADKFQSVINPYVTEQMLAIRAHKPIIHNVPKGHKIILSIGRFEEQKNMELLIQSFAKFQSFAKLSSKNCHLIILGDGALKGDCEKLVHTLGIEDYVSMPGFVPNVSDYLKAADLYMMTSRYEGLPAVILEALASNCPILSTDCFVAAREILEPITGCALIEDEDPVSIGKLMDEALQLSYQPSEEKRDAARVYSIENGIADHIAKIKAL